MVIPHADARSSPRIAYSQPLQFHKRGTGNVIATLSDNISIDGIGFASESFIAPDTALMFEIGIFSRTIRPIGKVVWSNPSGRSDRYRVGARFIELDPKEKEFLSDYITMRSDSVRRN